MFSHAILPCVSKLYTIEIGPTELRYVQDSISTSRRGVRHSLVLGRSEFRHHLGIEVGKGGPGGHWPPPMFG